MPDESPEQAGGDVAVGKATRRAWIRQATLSAFAQALPYPAIAPEGPVAPSGSKPDCDKTRWGRAGSDPSPARSGGRRSVVMTRRAAGEGPARFGDHRRDAQALRLGASGDWSAALRPQKASTASH